MKRICHVGAWGHNYGDRAIQRAMRDTFDDLSPDPLDWWYLNCQETVFTAEVVDQVNENADLLIVGGGGLLWDKPELNSPSGWQWQITEKEIARINVPFVLYALGWTQFPYNDPTGRAPMIQTLHAATEHAALTAARNDQTRRFWQACGAVVDAVVPDPALFLDGDLVPLEGVMRPLIGLCWASDKCSWRYLEPAGVNAWSWLGEVRTAVKSYSSTFMLVEHLPEADGLARDYLEPDVSAEANAKLTYPPLMSMAGQLAGLYRQCDVVLSMRKHGLIVPAGQGVPVVGLGDMPEVKWTAEQLGAEHFDTTATSAEIAAGIERALDRGAQADLAGLKRKAHAFNQKALALMGIEAREPVTVEVS